MIFQVLVYDEFNELVDDYRIGAWDIDHAEDYVCDKMVAKYGESSPDYTFHLRTFDGMSLGIETADLEAARAEFFKSLGLDTADAVC